MSIQQEKAALARIITALLPLGWEPCKLDDGGDDLIDLSHMDTEDVVENCAAVDMCHLHFRDEACRVATVVIIWGNSPEELIADATMSHGFDEALEQAGAWQE
ncbi:hypothetical protein OF001_U20240 [Pseudomonas sp. OF001]|uniref:hypothetical protein n=1 Tax=Pseudomonas sp. OF001 TaxID=2772300 RepID=UPI0019195EDB|nr:hypothetical protein [Pseudomonas sp. OF001]CAD5377313.1 hypothetical protein OF001_U20240 [Pseudomonas sp. OF001]